MSDELWKPVVGMEAFYDVSNLGRVRSRHAIGRPTKDGVLAQGQNTKGYMRVRFWTKHRRFSSVVHRLVLEAFIGPPPTPQHQCNHKDGCKQNNRVENLEWLTGLENVAHSVSTGLWKPHTGEAHGRAKISEAEVRTIRALEGIKLASELAAEYGVSKGAIRSIWKRRNWKHVTT